MEDLIEICKMREAAKIDLENMCTNFREQFNQMLRGKMDLGVPRYAGANSDGVTPQQSMKRAKKLSRVYEGEEIQESERSSRKSSSSLLAEADALERTSMRSQKSKIHETVINETAVIETASAKTIENEVVEEFSFARPTRQAKLKAEKNLKEPKTNIKLRRPSNSESDNSMIDKIKKEKDTSMVMSATPLSQLERRGSSVVICDKAPVVIDLMDDTPEKDALPLTECRVVIKREKLSLVSTEAEKEKTIIPTVETTKSHELTQTSSVPSNASNVSKKKKKHVPIKVERFSDIDKKQAANLERPSVYEDAVEKLPVANKANVINDQTITIPPATLSDATFNANDKTITIAKNNENKIDETFAVTGKASNNSRASSKHSMETAKDSVDNSLITEDESHHESPINVKIEKNNEAMNEKRMKNVASAKKDIQIPFAESPVKTKIKAFENAALANQAANSRLKENKPLPSSNSNTPLAGKLRSAALGRFLTPTQASNLTPQSMVMLTQAKKAPSSASKVATLIKSNSAKAKATSSTSSASVKSLSQKHLQAAQIREAKERERAERIAKFTKEREEKLQAKKQAEAEQRRQEENQRKLRAQQEAAEAEIKKKAAKLKIAEKEKELLKQIKNINLITPKPNELMPPPAVPKLSNKYCFEMLHEDDSTDDEDKVTFKRPPVPSWSRRGKREAAILMQQHFPTAIIDEYFSVAPTTFDLRVLFPDIDKRHLKRNSSAFWSTPPRYSELPKY